MSYLLNDDLKCKDVINDLKWEKETYMSPSSNESPLKLSREIHMKDHSIEVGEDMAHHDHSIVVWIYIETWFMN